MDQFDDLRERLHQRCTVIEASPNKRSELVATWRAGWGTEVPWLVSEQEVSGVGAATHLAALMGGSPRAAQVRRLAASRDRLEETETERRRWIDELSDAETARTQASVLEQRARNDRIAEEASIAIARATLQREQDELGKRSKARRYIDDRIAEASAEGEVRRSVYDQLRATENDLRRELEHRWVPDGRLATEGVDNVLQARLAIVDQLGNFGVSDPALLAEVGGKLEAARRGDYAPDETSVEFADQWAALVNRRRTAELREMEFQASLDSVEQQLGAAGDIVAATLELPVIDLRDDRSDSGDDRGDAVNVERPNGDAHDGSHASSNGSSSNGSTPADGDSELAMAAAAAAAAVTTLADSSPIDTDIAWPSLRPDLSPERRELVEALAGGLEDNSALLNRLRTTPDTELTAIAAEERDLRAQIVEHLGLDPGHGIEATLRTPLVVPRLPEQLLTDLEAAVDAANHRWWQVNWCIEAYATDRDHLDELIADSQTVVASAQRYVTDLEDALAQRREEENAAIRAMQESGRRVHEADVELARVTSEYDEAAAHNKRVEFDAERLLDQVVAVEQGTSPASLALAFGCDPITRSRVLDDIHTRITGLMESNHDVATHPLVFDDAFAFLPPADAVSLLDLLEMGADNVPFVYVTDDPVVLAWANRLLGDRAGVLRADAA
ncbi:MAG: hypothetical protein AB7L13_01115 [Acidimicrobiia bacterium]